MNSINEESGIMFGNGSGGGGGSPVAARPKTLQSTQSTVTLVDQMTPTSNSPRSPGTPKYHSQSSLKRNTSYGNIPSAEKTEARVLVIYTGGTIGMMRNEKNGKFVSDRGGQNPIACRRGRECN